MQIIRSVPYRKHDQLKEPAHRSAAMSASRISREVTDRDRLAGRHSALPTMRGPEVTQACGSPLAEDPGLAVPDRLAGTGEDGALAELLRSLLFAVRTVREAGAVAAFPIRGGVLTG